MKRITNNKYYGWGGIFKGKNAFRTLGAIAGTVLGPAGMVVGGVIGSKIDKNLNAPDSTVDNIIKTNEAEAAKATAEMERKKREAQYTNDIVALSNVKLTNNQLFSRGGKARINTIKGQVSRIDNNTVMLLNDRGTTAGSHEEGSNIPLSTSDGTVYAEPGELVTKDGNKEFVLSKRNILPNGNSPVEEYLNADTKQEKQDVIQANKVIAMRKSINGNARSNGGPISNINSFKARVESDTTSKDNARLFAYTEELDQALRKKNPKLFDELKAKASTTDINRRFEVADSVSKVNPSFYLTTDEQRKVLGDRYNDFDSLRVKRSNIYKRINEKGTIAGSNEGSESNSAFGARNSVIPSLAQYSGVDDQGNKNHAVIRYNSKDKSYTYDYTSSKKLLDGGSINLLSSLKGEVDNKIGNVKNMFNSYMGYRLTQKNLKNQGKLIDSMVKDSNNFNVSNLRANSLQTNVNTGRAEAEIDNKYLSASNDIRDRVSNSNVAAAYKSSMFLDSLNAKANVLMQKDLTEMDLRNKNAMNFQQVNNTNIERQDAEALRKLGVRMDGTTARINLISASNDNINNFVGQLGQINRDNQTYKTIMSRYPEVSGSMYGDDNTINSIKSLFGKKAYGGSIKLRKRIKI